MSPLLFYREQAVQQQGAADGAALDNVRDRCQRAANAWTALADRSERFEAARARTVADKLTHDLSLNPDRALADAIGDPALLRQ
jgi:hypothetical protein